MQGGSGQQGFKECLAHPSQLHQPQVSCPSHSCSLGPFLTPGPSYTPAGTLLL